MLFGLSDGECKVSASKYLRTLFTQYRTKIPVDPIRSEETIDLVSILGCDNSGDFNYRASICLTCYFLVYSPADDVFGLSVYVAAWFKSATPCMLCRQRNGFVFFGLQIASLYSCRGRCLKFQFKRLVE